MKLPDAHRAIVSREKIVDYLLSREHPHGRSKAAFFYGVGFTDERWTELTTALKRHATAHDVTEYRDTPFGTSYSIDGELAAPDGRAPFVRTVWFIEAGKDAPRFVTAYPVPRVK